MGDSTAMFTGLVQGVGTVREVATRAGGIRLGVDPGGWSHRPTLGESISIQGCCLTIAAPFDGVMRFDVMRETLAKTNLGGLKPGSRVNLERSLAAGDLMGGHIVQGHVDGVGTVERVQDGADWRVWVRPPAELMQFMVPKGSVCLDGVSLTLAGVEQEHGLVQVALIPTTLEVTTLKEWKSGSPVNIEADAMAKTIVHYLAHYGRSGT